MTNPQGAVREMRGEPMRSGASVVFGGHCPNNTGWSLVPTSFGLVGSLKDDPTTIGLVWLWTKDDVDLV